MDKVKLIATALTQDGISYLDCGSKHRGDAQ